MNEFILFGTTHLLTLSIIFAISLGVPFILRNYMPAIFLRMPQDYFY